MSIRLPPSIPCVLTQPRAARSSPWKGYIKTHDAPKSFSCSTYQLVFTRCFEDTFASKMSATEGSLACYDAILSVSEEAINRQLKTLYDTKIISPGSAAVVSETEGTDKDKDTPKPVDKYLLSHDLRIRPTEVIQGKEEYSGEGICPRYCQVVTLWNCFG